MFLFLVTFHLQLVGAYWYVCPINIVWPNDSWTNGMQSYGGMSYIPDNDLSNHVTAIELGLDQWGEIYTVKVIGGSIASSA